MIKIQNMEQFDNKKRTAEIKKEIVELKKEIANYEELLTTLNDNAIREQDIGRKYRDAEMQLHYLSRFVDHGCKFNADGKMVIEQGDPTRGTEQYGSKGYLVTINE